MVRIAPMLALTLALASAARADVPRLVTFNGYLVESNDRPVNADTTVRFAIYDTDRWEPGQAALWAASYRVTARGGSFSVVLGNRRDLAEGGTVLPASVFEHPEVWLGLTVEGGAELQPRLRFGSVPYALVASRATSADDALRLGGLEPSEFLTAQAADARFQEKGDFLTAAAASSSFQPKGDYLTPAVASSSFQPKGEYLTADAARALFATSGSYLTAADAAAAYQPKGSYLTISDAATTYQPKGSYLTISDAATTYQPKGSYLTISEAAAAYQPKGSYLTISEAAETYQPKGSYLTASAAAASFQAKGDYLGANCNGCVNTQHLAPSLTLGGTSTFTAGFVTTGAADFRSQPVTNFRLQRATSAPVTCASAQDGFAYFNASSRTLHVCDGATSTWMSAAMTAVTGGGGTPTGTGTYLFSNYDGGTWTINVDSPLSDIRIGITAYERVAVTITGTYAANVKAVRVIGYNASNSTISGVSSSLVTRVSSASATTVPAGCPGSILCAYSAGTCSSQGGCNSLEQVEHYFSTNFGTSVTRHKYQYGAYSGTLNLSAL